MSEPVFVSYSHRDKRWLDRVLVHLKPLERAGTLAVWSDTRISAGDDWRREIRAAVETARVALLLVSADFLASDFITRNELPPLLSAARKKGLVILPVILSPCRYAQTPALASLQSVNPPSKPLSALSKAASEQYLLSLSIQVEGLLTNPGKAKNRTDPATVVAGVVPHPDPGAAYVRSLGGDINTVSSDDVGRDVPIFGSADNQWAIVIGATPETMPPRDHISMEVIDAVDVLDWFWSPDVFGPLAPERRVLLVGEDTSSARLREVLDTLKQKIRRGDSVLLYYSGHATEFSLPGDLVLYDFPYGGDQQAAREKGLGLLPATALVDWCNEVRAAKVVCIMDVGGPAVYRASTALGRGRYIISALDGRVNGRNGILTWYVRRALQKLGRDTTVAQLHDILRESDAVLPSPLRVYLKGRDRSGNAR